MKAWVAPALLALLSIPFVATARAVESPRSPDLSHRYWPASWICAPATSPTAYGVYHFRKSIELPAAPTTYLVHVSADNRFHLFVNGTSVGRGPARGDPMHWRYETIDLAPHLHAGRNVIAAEVWNAADSKPWAQMSIRTAFVLQGDALAEAAVNTDDSWLASPDAGYAPQPIDRTALHTFIVSGDGDRVDASRHPWGWEQPEFNDRSWKHAVKVADAVPYGCSTDVEWWLVPDGLPPMEERPQRLQHVRRTSGIHASDAFLAGREPLRVPPHSRVSVLLDQTFETNAYPTLTVSGGKGSQIKLTYAEALVDAQGHKGNRNEVDDRRCIGKSDVFLPDGGANRRFTTLWFRTFRYVELDVETADEPLTLSDFTANFTGYPFERTAQFESDDPGLQSIWDVGWRTARLCAHETYFDCPYYEQLQYIGDTRIQALISLNVAGDDRLVRNAIDFFDRSRIPEGLTQSRYPSSSPQIINTFSLFWVEMLHDYWMHRDDAAFVEAKLPGARNVLDWFIQRIDAKTGMLGPLPYWTFVDWPDEWPWREAMHIGGEPPGAHEGGSAIVSLQLAATLADAADLFDAAGEHTTAARYRATAAQLNQRTIALCWDDHRKLVADTPAKTEFSQHANVLAVLSHAIQGAPARDVISRAAADRTLVQCTYYFRFYLLRAMKEAGLGDQYLASLGPWRDMLARGLTTFAERQEPTRSDCHAWSASPCYEFLATVCGVEPASPGFKTVRIEPHPGKLKRLVGAVPTGKGNVEVNYAISGPRIDAEITLPAGKTGEFIWHGRSTPLHAGAQHVIAE